MSDPLHPDVPAPVQHATERRSLTNTPLTRYFDAAVKHQTSDLLMRGGQVPKLRIRGALKGLDTPPLDED